MLNDNQIQCNAKAKSTGKQCQNPAVNGSEKCRLHGGKTPRGSASPHWQGKGRSKYLPQRLADSYAELEQDTEYNDLRANMRLREVFIREKLAMLDEAPESAKVWSEFQKLLDDFRKAWDDERLGAANDILRKLDRIVDERVLYFETHKEIRADLAEQRKDSQAIANIEYKGENAVTMSEVLTFVGAVLNLVTAHVNDRATQSKIFDGIDQLISAETRDTGAVRRITSND